ncbi:hypothetical protein F5880DRAFT_189149 [Lentinula raphanica]|nr:hypothetical protein F5880DRAFT_189149 [Lentinula raphanica]
MVGHLWFFITSAVGSVLRSFVIQTASARFLARSKPRLLRTLAYNGYVYHARINERNGRAERYDQHGNPTYIQQQFCCLMSR